MCRMRIQLHGQLRAQLYAQLVSQVKVDWAALGWGLSVGGDTQLALEGIGDFGT